MSLCAKQNWIVSSVRNRNTQSLPNQLGEKKMFNCQSIPVNNATDWFQTSITCTCDTQMTDDEARACVAKCVQ